MPCPVLTVLLIIMIYICFEHITSLGSVNDHKLCIILSLSSFTDPDGNIKMDGFVGFFNHTNSSSAQLYEVSIDSSSLQGCE